MSSVSTRCCGDIVGPHNSTTHISLKPINALQRTIPHADTHTHTPIWTQTSCLHCTHPRTPLFLHRYTHTHTHTHTSQTQHLKEAHTATITFLTFLIINVCDSRGPCSRQTACWEEMSEPKPTEPKCRSATTRMDVGLILNVLWIQDRTSTFTLQ